MFGDNDPFSEGYKNETMPRVRIILNKDIFIPFLHPLLPSGEPMEGEPMEGEQEHDDEYETYRRNRRGITKRTEKKWKKGKKSSDHFELVEDSGVDFRDVGG
jgi:hypothetical protein